MPNESNSGRANASCVHFGGPGSPDGALRDLLAERVRASGSGDRIDFVTYYFRDRRLARDLVAAAERGADVLVTLEGRPRRRDANDAVVALLGDAAARLRTLAFRALVHAPILPGVAARARLHEKLYLFSNPAAAFIGSFNPSGDSPEEAPDVVAEIGDHDRGHNLLVELGEPALVEALRAHASLVFAGTHGRLERLRPARIARSDGTRVFALPAIGAHPFLAAVAALARGDRARIVASHVSGRAAPRTLARAAARGARIELLSHASERRFPPATEAALRSAGVATRRRGDAHAHPMHDKFALLEHGGVREAWFGSFNLNTQSRWLNHELGVATREAGVVEALEARWAAHSDAVDQPT